MSKSVEHEINDIIEQIVSTFNWVLKYNQDIKDMAEGIEFKPIQERIILLSDCLRDTIKNAGMCLTYGPLDEIYNKLSEINQSRLSVTMEGLEALNDEVNFNIE